jgi:haloalkane dehalogenase
LIGFGRSDKPADGDAYTYARHATWLADLIFNTLDLHEITLFCQDWGGLLGLRLVGESPERFAAVVASNTFLPTGDRPLGEAFEAWRAFAQRVEEFPVSFILQGASHRELNAEELKAYDAPFPDESYKAGARRFPALVPDSPEDPGAVDNRKAWAGLAAFERPFICAFGDSDPVTKGADHVLEKLIAGAAGQPHETLVDTAHFCQEDSPQRIAEIILAASGRG